MGKQAMEFRLIYLVLILSLNPFFGEIQANSYKKDLLSEVRKTTVYYKVSFLDPENPENVCTVSSQGTGFIISTRGHVLTAYHPFKIPESCSGFTKLKVEGRIGYHGSGEWLSLKQAASFDTFSDIALFYLPERESKYERVKYCIKNNIEYFDSLYAVGFPQGTGLDIIEVEYSGRSDEKDRWKSKSIFTYGMSGGPVYDDNGNVLGLVQGGIKNTPAVRYIVPIRHARNYIEHTGEEIKKCNQDVSSETSLESIIPIYNDPIEFISKAANEAVVSVTQAANNISPDKYFYGKKLKLLGYASYEGSNVNYDYWCSIYLECDLPSVVELNHAPVEMSFIGKSGSKSINYMPANLKKGEGYRSISNNRFRRKYSVKGFDKIHFHLWTRSNTNKDYDDFIECHKLNNCEEKISNCDSHLAIYYRIDQGQWKHWSSICGQTRKEEKWYKVQLQKLVENSEIFEVAFTMNVQGLEKDMVNRHFLVDDVLLFLEK